MGKYYISIPRNIDGINDYNNMVDESENLELVKIPDDEFSRFYINFCDKLNEVCDSIIDEFESDTLNNEQLHRAEEILNDIKIYPTIYECFIKALQYDTELYFDL